MNARLDAEAQRDGIGRGELARVSGEQRLPIEAVPIGKGQQLETIRIRDRRTGGLPQRFEVRAVLGEAGCAVQKPFGLVQELVRFLSAAGFDQQTD